MSDFRQAVRARLFRALRAIFRALPLDTGTRDRWRARFLRRHADWAPPAMRGQAPAGARARRARVRTDEAAIGHVAYSREALPESLPARLIAFYLPQFHPIPENDAWWGKGFTEWRNVTRALPQFEGHAQPRLPADLGYYDLRDTDVMREQARLAAQYGIGAFCFYFYWFDGKTLLEQPLRQWLDDTSITLPFCLCWANENWARRWDGRDQDVLIAQRHSAEDDLAFIAHVSPYLRDQRYLRVDGKPILLVYRPYLLPDARATAARWRHWCREQGIGEIHLAYVQGFERPHPGDIGFDAAVEFPPNMSTPPSITAAQTLINPDYAGDVLDWRALAQEIAARPLPAYRLYPGVNPGWDNEPRRSGRSRVFLHASPRGYGEWLRRTIDERLRGVPDEQRLVFINAWNEWAEGAVLEPDVRLGHAWLAQTRRALSPLPRPTAQVATVIHAWYGDALPSLLRDWRAAGVPGRLLVTTAPERSEAIAAILQAEGVAAELCVYENRGRDVLPFLHVANRLLEEGVEIVLKLHTKRSVHRDDGDDWAAEIRSALLSKATAMLEALFEHPSLGMLAPAGHLLPLTEFVGGNAPILDYLDARMGTQRRPQARFASGTMFWAKLAALRPLLDAHLCPGDFEAETGQIDATLAHAIERGFGVAVEAAGFAVASTEDPRPGGAIAASPSYRYARAST